MMDSHDNHPFADLLGMRFEEEGAGHSICGVTVREALLNPHGVVHGAVLYMLADTGMGGALYPTLDTGEACATLEIKISYFHPVRSGRIECETRLLHRTRRVAALESEVRAEGRLVAKATGTYAIFRPTSRV